MIYVALVTLLLIIQLLVFMMRVGMARGKHNINAPDISGNPEFECARRVHINTVEQLAIVLPALWLCALHFNQDVAAILGAIFFVGRIIYAVGYKAANPSKRAPGMMLGFLATVGMIGCAAWGIVGALI